MLCNFSVRMLKYFLKIKKKIFAHKKLKKPPQKVAYLWQLGGFFLYSPDCRKQPRTSFPFYKFFYPVVSAKVSAPQSLQIYLIVFKDHSCCCWICSHLFDPCRFGRKIVFSQLWVGVDFGVRCRIWRVWRGRRWEGKSARTSSFKFIVVTPGATSLAENNKIMFTGCLIAKISSIMYKC